MNIMRPTIGNNKRKYNMEKIVMLVRVVILLSIKVTICYREPRFVIKQKYPMYTEIIWFKEDYTCTQLGGYLKVALVLRIDQSNKST